MNGVLERDFTRDKLRALLNKELFAVSEDSSEHRRKLSSWFERRNKK